MRVVVNGAAAAKIERISPATGRRVIHIVKTTSTAPFTMGTSHCGQ